MWYDHAIAIITILFMLGGIMYAIHWADKQALDQLSDDGSKVIVEKVTKTFTVFVSSGVVKEHYDSKGNVKAITAYSNLGVPFYFTQVHQEFYEKGHLIHVDRWGRCWKRMSA